MSDILNDGSVVAGIAEDLTINGQVYVCIDISMNIGSNSVIRGDRQNLPSGRKETRAEQTGSMTLQLSDATQPTLALLFATFTSTKYGNCYITSVGLAQTQGGQTTVPCTIKKAITGSVVVT